jgi:hypothetical protein
MRPIINPSTAELLMANYLEDTDDDASSSNDAVDGGDLLSLSALISPDDWRLYHIMRELRGDDRARVLAFAEMLFNMQRAKKWADPK